IGDAKRISQILINFANNAVKFTEQGGIVLRVSEQENDGEQIRLCFEVEDTGIGIAPDKLPLLFRPFQQIDGSMSRAFEGTGLGLAISRNLAGLMDGTVEVRSRPGQGSVFSLTLPLRLGVAQEDAGRVEETPPVPAGESGAARKIWNLEGQSILLVEDNPINQEVVLGLLEMVGAQVTLASDGGEGVRLLETRAFDLVLMDIHTPNMDGFEATARIRQNPRLAHMPIVALTANALAGDLERCLAAGMDDYIAKPIQPERLFAVLARYCRRKTAPDAVPGHDSGTPIREDDARLLARVAGIDGIDSESACARLLGRRDLYAQLVRRFVAEGPGMRLAIENAHRNDNHRATVDAIHSVKSVLGLLGAGALERCCVTLQQHFAQGTQNDNEVADFIEELTALLQRLRACHEGASSSHDEGNAVLFDP
ncbi:MAG: response regulator, partial [Candidatus Accumulibacter sp.]|nr:response regulator [Accumulibacter sp.]